MTGAALSIDLLSDETYLHQIQGVDFRPVFIIGPHRSGTTLLYRVLTCWIPVFIGWPVMRWLTENDMV